LSEEIRRARDAHDADYRTFTNALSD
jgi:hypothetical protein